MAIAIVQTTAKQTGNGVTTLNFSITGVTAGSTIFVPLVTFTGTFGISVSDATDGKYTRDFTHANGNSCVSLYRLDNASAGSHSITIDHPSGGIYIKTCAIEASSSGPLLMDTNSVAGGSSTTPSSGATNDTVIADELLIAIVSTPVSQASITVAVTSPVWVQEMEELSATVQAGEIDTKIVSSTGSYTADWTLASTGQWAALICTYAESGGGGGGGGEHSAVF